MAQSTGLGNPLLTAMRDYFLQILITIKFLQRVILTEILTEGQIAGHQIGIIQI